MRSESRRMWGVGSAIVIASVLMLALGGVPASASVSFDRTDVTVPGAPDSVALGDLGQATVDGLGTIGTGLIAALYQGTVGKYMKTPYSSIIAQGLGLTDTVTGETIPDKVTKPFDPSRN